MHINYYSLRNANYWFEIFSGKYLDRKKVRGKLKNTDLIFVDVLTDTNIIYSGFLKDFNYSPTKDLLENIVMTATRKRDYQKLMQAGKEGVIGKSKKTTSAVHIPGDVFLIPMDKIKNINIHYISLKKREHEISST